MASSLLDLHWAVLVPVNALVYWIGTIIAHLRLLSNGRPANPLDERGYSRIGINSLHIASGRQQGAL